MAEQQQSTESTNFLRKFRDDKTREFKKINAEQFMEVWNHYDRNGDGYIEGNELDNFLRELVSSACATDCGPEVICEAAFENAKEHILAAFDHNKDGRIDIAELADILPMEENFLLRFRRENPLESSVEFMRIWREFDTDHSGYIEADELKNFLRSLHRKAKGDDIVLDEETLTAQTGDVLQFFDKNKDGKLQLSEMAKLLPVKENFLCRPIFKNTNKMTEDDIKRVFRLYDRDNNGSIENVELDGFLKDLMELIETDYTEEDLFDCKQILLEKCDLDQNGKIDLNELTMILMSVPDQ